MTVAMVDGYRVPAAQQDAFLSAARDTFAMAESLAANAALRNVLVGGDLSEVQWAIFVFPDAVARGDYLDNVTRPEPVVRHALAQLSRAGGVALLGRSFLDELPAANEAPRQPQVLSSICFRVTPGREAQAD